MTGIEAAFVGRLGRPPDMRQTRTGKTMAVLNVAVDEGDDATSWVKVLAFEGDAAVCRDLEPGARLYVEGRAKVEQWTAKDGTPRAGMTLLARLVQPLGQIGRRRPRPPGPPRRAEQAAIRARHRELDRAADGAAARDDAPFDDVEALELIGGPR